ncbi:hypothetical protein [Kitasatospora sp. NPDC057223]|uniref:hypothetical protein n=1 Tax=Kitasatospora sp. NPDC057223 TaxID=3346055 RepID=UPI00362D31C7
MAGHYPGRYGPPPGPPTPGGAYRKPAGPYGVAGKVLCCLAPLLTAGLLCMVPSLVLAVRRRRAYDVAGAVLFIVLFGVYVVSAVVAGSSKSGHSTADTTGMVAMVLCWLGSPLHFLAMDWRVVWAAGAQRVPAHDRPVPPVPPVQPVRSDWYTATAPTAGAMPVVPSPPAAPDAFPLLARYEAPQAPAPQTPAPQAPAFPPGPALRPAATNPADDLQELGELLRRQAEQGRP